MAPAGGAEKAQLVATALTQRPFYPPNRGAPNPNVEGMESNPRRSISPGLRIRKPTLAGTYRVWTNLHTFKVIDFDADRRDGQRTR